jgi:hypothetical protein
MTLILEYPNSKDDLRTQYELKLKRWYDSTRLQYHLGVAAWFSLFILASFCAYSAGYVSCVILFLVVAGKYLYNTLPYSRAYRSQLDEWSTDQPNTVIKLEIREDGLFETEEGIESFVPWTSVKSYTLFSDTLFINLSAGLCAIIPRPSVTPNPSAVDEVIRILKGKGIPETDSQ